MGEAVLREPDSSCCIPRREKNTAFQPHQSQRQDLWLKLNGVDTLIQRIGFTDRWQILVLGPTATTFVTNLGLPINEGLEGVIVFIDLDDLNSITSSGKLLA